MARARVREVLTTAQDPVAVLVQIANDEGVETSLRIQAASSAAPYIFPRLSASVVATAPVAAKDDGARLIDRLMAKIARLAPPCETIDGVAEAGSAIGALA